MKLAIIGASTGQLPLCNKAKELGHTVICFAWENGAVCNDIVDRFYPISIFEKEEILKICRKENIDGVVSNASDATAEVTSYIATEMGLHGINYKSFISLKDKSVVRLLTEKVPELSQVKSRLLEDDKEAFFPCIVKPVTGNAKKGVTLVRCESDLHTAKILAMEESTDCPIMIEQYISGAEISVETISFEGKHFIIQITDKENSGAPHFVELSHHQPSKISNAASTKIRKIIPLLLDTVNLQNGASHIEMIVTPHDKVYLIEINPRGGGDEISNKLVRLSTGYDYLQGMIEVALGTFKEPVLGEGKCSGIYYLCQQRVDRLPTFKDNTEHEWLVEKHYDISNGLNEATGNYDRNGYLIYQSNNRIEID